MYTRVAPKNVPVPTLTSPKPIVPPSPIDSSVAGSPSNQTRAASETASPRPEQLRQEDTNFQQGPDTVTTPSIASEASSLSLANTTTQDSQVLNDTLNVINEHITDLRSPSEGTLAMRPAATDSGSEYSVPLEQRMSYIQGEETDEEEDDSHTRREVEGWTPEDVAQYLYVAGVEEKHCEVFRDQEISGEVLLGMDQSSLFIKAFDLGSVGRRLKTWHKIKALQEEVGSSDFSGKRTTQTYGSEAGSEGARRNRSRNNTITTSGTGRPGSIQTRHLSSTQTPKASPTTTLGSPASPHQPSGHAKRPSAASIREMQHARRYSSTDFRLGSAGGAPKFQSSVTSPPPESSHKKQPSFDRNWTLGNAFGTPPARPLSSAGLQDIIAQSDPDAQDGGPDFDRGYFSGNEVDGRRRNVLRKRESTGNTLHSRNSSYAEEQRVRNATALSRHSRFGSVDSYRDGPSTAAQKYYGVQSTAHRRTASTNTTESVRPLPPLKDTLPPSVTKLEPGAGRTQLSPQSHWFSSVVGRGSPKDRSPGMRAISDKLGMDRPRPFGSAEPSPKNPSLDSPAPTTSSTPSAGPSFEFDSPDATQTGGSVSTTPGSKASRKKGKKGTSAYTRGLLKIGPREAKEGADYCGWMKKKSSRVMTTWKPRFFVLKGRRLSYYYSEDDEEEKGLIDISFHRVLPADNEKLTGLHATITNAVGGPSIPNSTLSPTSPEDQFGAKGESVFIFKLVPPRAGLSRAVTFTKPTVHYFAVPNVTQGRLWMAAMMKATIDRDDTQPITTTYQQKTISLARAKQMRHRPPALMNLDEAPNEDQQKPAGGHQVANSTGGLGIYGEADSGVSGVDKLAPGVNTTNNGSSTPLPHITSTNNSSIQLTGTPSSEHAPSLQQDSGNAVQQGA